MKIKITKEMLDGRTLVFDPATPGWATNGIFMIRRELIDDDTSVMAMDFLPGFIGRRLVGFQEIKRWRAVVKKIGAESVKGVSKKYACTKFAERTTSKAVTLIQSRFVPLLAGLEVVRIGKDALSPVAGRDAKGKIVVYIMPCRT